MEIKHKNIPNVERFNEILLMYDSNEPRENEIYFNSTLIPILPKKPFKGKINFIQKFVGDYLHSWVTNDCILNFASAKKPGGGTLAGSVAQEEDICRNSLLYFWLREFNQSHYRKGLFKEGIFYQDFVIFSKDVPTVSPDLSLRGTNNYITSAAPNLYNIELNPQLELSLDEIWRRRIEKVFNIAWSNKCEKITLGPWGCGVFKNNPFKVSSYFKEAIELYGGHFKQITFLLPDKSQSKIFVDQLKF